MNIRDKVFELNKLGFMYPLVEVDGIYKILKNKIEYSHSDRARYKQYAIMWFNLLKEIWDTSVSETLDLNPLVSDIEKGMYKHLYHDEIIKQHGEWFLHDADDNKAAYGEAFFNFVKEKYESSIA